MTTAGARRVAWLAALSVLAVAVAVLIAHRHRHHAALPAGAGPWHSALAADAAVRFERLRPPEGQDWNDVLVERRGA